MGKIINSIARIKGWMGKQKTLRYHDTMPVRSSYGRSKTRYGVKMLVIREGNPERRIEPGLDEVQAVGSWGTGRAAAKVARRLFIPHVRTGVPFQFDR